MADGEKTWDILVIRAISSHIRIDSSFLKTLQKIFEFKDNGFFIGQVASSTGQVPLEVLEHCKDLEKLQLIEEDPMPIKSTAEIFFKLSNKGLAIEDRLKKHSVIS